MDIIGLLMHFCYSIYVSPTMVTNCCRRQVLLDKVQREGKLFNIDFKKITIVYS